MSANTPETGSHRLMLPDGRALELNWASQTDTGRRRDVNQDAHLARFPIFAVADGMGGHDAGEIASAAVIAQLSRWAAAIPLEDEGLTNALRAAVSDMEAEVGPSESGTGTTVTGAYFAVADGGPRWTVFNIGDSRVYRFLDDELVQVTVDHSVVQELLSIGAITLEEADAHPQGNVITRAVGVSGDPVPDVTRVPAGVGARWLICSDGLTKELTDYGLRHFLDAAAEPAEAVSELMEAALANGGRDNISIIVVDEIVRTGTL